MFRRYIKPLAAALVLTLTVVAFARFIAQHPAALHQLSHVHPATLVILIALYVITLVCLAFAQEGMMELCNTKLEHSEAFLLTSYTAIINFFGPLQSGPGFRAVYLRKKYGTKLKNYVLATFLYLAYFAAFSGLLLLSALVSWAWLGAAAVVVLLAIFIAVRLELPLARRLRRLRLKGAFIIGIATAAQIITTTVIYYTELHSVNSTVHFSQALIYTGAAGFSLFVSITPAAIGFRESFLLFSQHLHHISSANIVSANLLDRGIYIVFLGLLLLVVMALHAKQRLLKRIAADS